MIDHKRIIAWLIRSYELLSDNADYLTDLDRTIGDGDHGLNMKRGFAKVCEFLTASPSCDIGAIFKNTGMVLLSHVGGASGPLFGTFFLKAATLLEGQERISIAQLNHAFDAGVAGVIARGRAKIGDKTMVDVLKPLLDDYARAMTAGTPSGQLFDMLSQHAKNYAEKTKDLIAKKGRASYLGERSVGHIDPGSASVALIVQALSEVMGD